MGQSKFQIQEAVIARHELAGWRCEHINEDGERCPERSQQIAHFIRKKQQGRAAIRPLWFEMTGELLNIYGERMNIIVHHKFNTAASCILHNSYFLVGMSDDSKHREILTKILEDI